MGIQEYDTTRCSKCRYSRLLNTGSRRDGEKCWAGMYITLAGKRRGCPPGDKCDKFDPSIKHVMRLNSLFSRKEEVSSNE